MATIARGLSVLLPREFAAGRFQRAIAIGGLNGALMAAAGLRALPFGVPKLIVSPLASGERKFGPFVGTSDIAVLHSVVDLQGINRFTRTILDEAAMMITGSRAPLPVLPPTVGTVAMTLNGNTTPVGMRVLHTLEGAGWEVVAFHSNGTGGSAMERLAAEGGFDAIIDLTTNELVERELNGSFQVPESRMRLLAASGLPTVFVPGCMDFICLPPEAVRSRDGDRRHTRHSPGLELVRVTSEEAAGLARVFADSVRRHAGPTEVVVPLQGFSPSAGPGGPLEDVAADREFVRTLQSSLQDSAPVTLVDAPINDDRVARAIVGAFERVVTAGAPRSSSGREADRAG